MNQVAWYLKVEFIHHYNLTITVKLFIKLNFKVEYPPLSEHLHWNLKNAYIPSINSANDIFEFGMIHSKIKMFIKKYISLKKQS